jgi:hypothetical protein
MDHTAQPDLSPQPKLTPKERWNLLVEKHPTALIITAFILLPFLIFGVVLLGLKLKNVGSGSTADVTPSPTITISMAEENDDDEEEDEDEDLEPTNTPRTSTTPSRTPTTKPTNAATNTPAATSTPTKQANLYFHSVSCTYTASGSATANLENASIPSDSVPDTAHCDIVFQNSEDVESGEIRYQIHSDSDEQKKADVGKLKKGDYPNSEYKKFSEVLKLQKSTGTHELKFELNKDKTFPESNYSDNTRIIKYTVL